MRKISIIIFLYLIIVNEGKAQNTDTLFLITGDTIIGSIYAQNKYITKIHTDTAWLFIQNSEIIQKIEEPQLYESTEAPELQSSPEFYSIPIGEPIAIKTNRTLSSRYAKSGEIFECRLAQRIVNREGRVILPENTPLIGRVTFAQNGNAFQRAQLKFELIEIHINGEAIPIQTSDQIRILNNYTAERILGSAGTGSVIGGVFYNEWLEGALVGAALGTVTSLFVENKNIVIPENSTLEFMLDSRTNIRLR